MTESVSRSHRRLWRVVTTVVTIVSENNHLSVNNDQQEWSNESGHHSQSETSPGATTQPINSWRRVVIVLHWSGVRVVCCWLCDGNDRNYQWLHVVCVGQLQCSGPEADTMIHDTLHDTLQSYFLTLSSCYCFLYCSYLLTTPPSSPLRDLCNAVQI